ncbi:MTH938/NDUFAF3 family protein [Devosia algicola]|uniref:MTH938/NDUFAF3 family protein n=1 Tax=Devosia algicola TaxID=3026418 RepID=A0ABY7YSF6_9HYPH|nr:MTH938/NDUFAF3 family protein [Devosia algicola]WDR04226.1 MTH938/NDUFAF3 family protein [Devosia algicola]
MSGHYPYQVQIDAYGSGGFRFADMSHRGSLLCLPSGMHAWPITDATEITIESLAQILALSDQVDVLLIGLGRDITALKPEILDALHAKNVIVEAVATGGAVRTYNILLGEKRAVAAALIAVETVR